MKPESTDTISDDQGNPHVDSLFRQAEFAKTLGRRIGELTYSAVGLAKAFPAALITVALEKNTSRIASNTAALNRIAAALETIATRKP